ncbi:polyprenyl synthetase family protein [Acidobacteria bacterium AH-259-D05]|nr:polyprenyl synthetase family protein [Acidobacteria bacterium AH-259-D05]
MKTVSSVFLTPKDIFKLVEDDLQEVEITLKAESKSAFTLVDDINEYLHSSGGKRFRPVLLLLASKLCGFEGKAALVLSAVVELIHVATLVHDDIIDDANVRRGKPSVNARWGNQVTVLMGDWLYMTSFRQALELRNFRVLDILIDITRKMIEGELIQLEQRGRLDVSVQEHLEVCRRKTAHLFSGCGRLGAILANVGADREEKLHIYGHSVGMAFQLTDDLLDYTSNEDTLGKPVLKDLAEGKITLPIIYLMQRADRSEQDFIRNVVRTQDFSPQNKQRIIELAQAYGTLEDLQHLAEEYIGQAKKALLAFPDSIYRDALRSLGEFVIDRKK